MQRAHEPARLDVRVVQVERGPLGPDAPGIRVKLCRGGGHKVAHYREFAKPHGSSAVTSSPYFHVL